MDSVRNPYVPGAGRQPRILAGRDDELEQADIAVQRLLLGRTANGLMLLGLRGAGKTVLLNRMQAKAAERGALSFKIEAPEGGSLPALLIPELRKMLYKLDLSQAAGQFVKTAGLALRNFASVFKVAVGEMEFGLESMPGTADTGDLEQDLPQLLVAVGEAAREKAHALVIFIDEIQYLSKTELAAIIVAMHELTQRELPVLLIGAGLPQIAALAGNAKSYAERLFDYPEIGPLATTAATEALEVPAREEGVEYEPSALSLIIEETQGYPFFLQVWGSFVWDGALKSPITTDTVRQVAPRIIEALDKNFFRVRFDRMTPLQQKYLRAMAELGEGPHQTGKIAEALGVEPFAVSTTRAQLISKGMVWSQRHGETDFTVPLFDKFMQRQMPELLKHVPQKRL